MNPGRALVGGLLLLLGGCAGGERKTAADQQAADAATPGAAEEKGPEPAASDPWAHPAGGPAGAPPAAPAVVRFREPEEPRPVAVEKRPALPPRAVLGVVAVRDGRLAPEGDLLLGLGAELSQERELEQVVGPGGAPDPPEVDLAGLARLAGAVGRHLLLVEVRPPRRAGGLADGYLVHAPSGALLACWSAGAGPPPLPTGETPDLPARIARAHARQVAGER